MEMVVPYTIAFSYLSLVAILLVLSRSAVHVERKPGEKRFDALGREY